MSYFVSLHEDMRDAYEVVSASSHDHAADIASATVSGSPLYVMHNGDMRVIDIDGEEMSAAASAPGWDSWDGRSVRFNFIRVDSALETEEFIL